MRKIAAPESKPAWVNADRSEARAAGRALAMRGLSKKQAETAASHQANVAAVPLQYRTRWLAECNKSFKKVRRNIVDGKADSA